MIIGFVIIFRFKNPIIVCIDGAVIDKLISKQFNFILTKQNLSQSNSLSPMKIPKFKKNKKKINGNRFQFNGKFVTHWGVSILNTWLDGWLTAWLAG